MKKMIFAVMIAGGLMATSVAISPDYRNEICKNNKTNFS